MSSMNNFNIDLHDLTLALSRALDLACGEMTDHARRVAYMAGCVAESLPLTQDEKGDLQSAALLHDAGVSSSDEHKNLLQFNWDTAREHCLEGALLLRGFPPFIKPAEIIRHHRNRWTEFADMDIPERITLAANLVLLADRFDARIDRNGPIPANLDELKAGITKLTGTFFNPNLVELFFKALSDENFWSDLQPERIESALKRLRPEKSLKLSLDDLEDAAAIFGRIVDRKSPYTAFHSEGVSRLCVLLATEMALPKKTVQGLRIAGQVHDLGKLAVPEEILNKPGRLTTEEFRIIQRHPLNTHETLSDIAGLEEIRSWASCHHERTDGTGYPFHLTAQDLSLEHLIVIVSEIVQALIQDRPYRQGLPKEHVLDILDHLTGRYPEFEPLVDIVHEEFDLIRHLAAGLR